jgi:hypothetical protein
MNETENKNLTKEEATAFFSEFYGGQHHIPHSGVKHCGLGFKVIHQQGNLATVDGNSLTKLVLMAHDKCIRVEVMPVNFSNLQIAIWKRQNRDGGITERHPTIEQAIESFRGK